MVRRAALVTGASSGIGLAIARMLVEEGFGVTAVARRREKLEDAAAELVNSGAEVESFAGNVSSEEVVRAAVDAHRKRFGRLDVLVNSAGVGIGESVGEIETKHLDLQLQVNLRAIVLFYRECAELLEIAGQEHRNALVVNLSSIAGKRGQPWISVYSATKHAVIGFTQAMNKELSASGVKSCALAPAYVDTVLTNWVKDSVPPEQMIRPEDLAAGVRMLLRLSPCALVPEIVLQRVPSEADRALDRE